MGSPYQTWPETTIFWGAGASASLGFPATAKQGELLRKWGRGTEDGLDSVRQGLGEISCHPAVIENVVDLLDILGFGVGQTLLQAEPRQEDVIRRVFPALEDLREVLDRIAWLRIRYDWDALQRIIQMQPEKGGEAAFLMGLFNTIDMHLHARLSFNVLSAKSERPKETLTHTRLMGARNCLVLLIGMMLRGAYLDLVENHPEKLKPYQSFAEALTRLMQEEGVRLLEDEGLPADSRDAYLFSYAIISMNFEPLIMWLLFNAHKDANDSSPPHVGKDVAQPLKLFHDFAHFVGARWILGPGDEPGRIWYPYNESVVQRINDPEHRCGRIVRVGKFYFLHGCYCWRECPSCGKLNAHWGDKWSPTSRTLFPPTPLEPDSEIMSKAQGDGEREKRKKGVSDCLQCVYCGAQTESMHTPLVMQTSFKGGNPPFLDEIVRDVRACLENTRHIVLMGYSLPPDDVIYRSLLSSRCANKENPIRCTVVVGHQGGNGWIHGDKLTEHRERYKNVDDPGSYGVPTIQAAVEIFGLENVRAYLGGIPQVFTHAGDAHASARELLYPENLGMDCFGSEGVIRKKK